jgi:hypothetical protein
MTSSLNKLSTTIKLLLICIGIIFLFSFPNYFAYISTPPNLVFTGQASRFDPWDINVYVAAINWSQRNGFNSLNAYTTDNGKTVIMYPLYTALGTIFSKTNPFLVYHLASIIFGLGLLLVIFKLVKIFITKDNKSLKALLLISLGGGLGWLFYPIVLTPDIATTPFTFTSTFQEPHEILAMTFYLSSLCLFYLGTKRKKLSLIVISSFLTYPVIVFYPFYLLSYYLICGIFTLTTFIKEKKKYLLCYFVTSVLITLPVGISYSFYLLSSNVFKNVLSPNLTTPNLFMIYLGYGIFSLGIVYQLLQKNKNSALLFLNIWFWLSLALAYLPLGFSRYYLRALFFPVVIIVLINIDKISSKLRVKPTIVWVIIFCLAIPTSLVISLGRINAAKNSSRWYYITEEEKKAIDFLDLKSPKESGVLSSYILGNYIPTQTQNRVYFGHTYQTPNSKEKKDNLYNFYSNKLTEKEAQNFLQTNNISFIIWGPDERIITENSKNSELEYQFLETVYNNPKVTIFSFKNK